MQLHQLIQDADAQHQSSNQILYKYFFQHY